MIAYGVYNKTKVSNCQYDTGVKVTLLKAYLQFIMQIPLACLIEAVHIWHNTCLCRVHTNKGLGIWTDLWVKDQSQPFLNMSYC